MKIFAYSLAIVLTTSSVGAQVGPAPSDEVLVIQSQEFEAENDGDKLVGGASRYPVSSVEFPLRFWAPVDLPAGAIVTGLALDFCRAADGNSLVVDLKESCNEGSCHPNGPGEEGVTTNGVEGCSQNFHPHFGRPAAEPRRKLYHVVARFSGTGDSVKLNAARVYFRRTIATPTETPTFNDVAVDHPFFAVIEALYASGATAGCGDGNFCPDSPMTRAQASAFFAKLMGLGW